MKIKSLDPRVTRSNIDEDTQEGILNPLDHFETYEVFEQRKRGTHHIHVGSVHAPSAEMAVVFAKEQYTRRGQCVNLWVVKTSDVFVTEYEDSDIFETTVNKKYREPDAYKVIDRINAFKERNSKQNA
jgi:ring-1,2-phenylacetyl-CoA epoxidase subunit PaaB